MELFLYTYNCGYIELNYWLWEFAFWVFNFIDLITISSVMVLMEKLNLGFRHWRFACKYFSSSCLQGSLLSWCFVCYTYFFFHFYWAEKHQKSCRTIMLMYLPIASKGCLQKEAVFRLYVKFCSLLFPIWSI